MNWVDLLIAAVIAWTTLRGFSVGLIRQTVMLLAVVAGIFLGGMLYDDLAENLDFLIEDATTRNLVGFGAIVIGAMIAGSVLAAVLKTTASLLLLGPLDSIGGAVVGFLRGLLYVQLALIAFAVFPASEVASKAVDDSRLAPLFLDRLPLVEIGLPSEFANPLEQLEAWREALGALTPILGEGADVVPAATARAGE
jgi:membrane protein required for colicin V production